MQSLPRAEWLRLAGLAERVSLPYGKVVCRAGEPSAHVYFPLSGALSSVVLLESGETVEVWLTGSEGMVGVGLLAGSRVSPFRLIQQVPGEMLRIRAGEFQRALEETPVLRRLVQRYALVLVEWGAQGAACNQHDTVEERMCRWLLEMADRVGGDEFEMTQEVLSEMLGVRRQTVNTTARLLQQARLIDYRRGRVTILDRTGLEQVSCECYRRNAESYRRLMGFDETS